MESYMDLARLLETSMRNVVVTDVVKTRVEVIEESLLVFIDELLL